MVESLGGGGGVESGTFGGGGRDGGVGNYYGLETGDEAVG